MASVQNLSFPRFNSPAGPSTKCVGPFGDDHHGHSHADSVSISKRPEAPLGPSKVGISEQLRQEVVTLTQDLVRINSGPDNLVAGENATVDRMVAYAQEAGLVSERFETVDGKPMLIITLPGSDPEAGSMGFVHHTDVVQPEGEWKLGEPFSGKLTHDEAGRECIVGRGTVDTKGPAAQVLVAMKHLKEKGIVPKETVKLFMFPDEEFGGKAGAWHLSRTRPELFRDVRHWVVEGSGIFSPEFMNGLVGDQDVPYVAVAQKYTIPMQLELKQAAAPAQAVEKTMAALERADDYIDGRDWTYLGDKAESKEAMKRMGKAIGGFKGFLIRHFYSTRFMQKRMGKGNAAANRSDFCKTDFYLSNNPAGSIQGPNVKPSSASVVVQLDLQGKARQDALTTMRAAAGEEMEVVELESGAVRLSLPQEHYHGGNHGSTADRDNDAVDVTARALKNVQKKFKKAGLADKLKVVDVFTSKSQRTPSLSQDPVKTHVTLDLRIAVDESPQEVIADLQKVVGEDFQLSPTVGSEQLDAKVRRLSYRSPLFQAAEGAIKNVYGADTPVLFGNTTASNDVRFLMESNPNSEALTFVPIVYTRHGAHGPDEAVTTRSLKQGLDWIVDLIQKVG